MYISPRGDRVWQGDVFKNLVIKDAYNTAVEVPFDFCIVLTQDCDLQQDSNAKITFEVSGDGDNNNSGGGKVPDNDKFLSTIIVCPAFPAASLRDGTHMLRVEWKMQHLYTNLWKPVKNNENPRYHYLLACPEYGLPELVIDFKQIYTLPIDYINGMAGNKVARLDDLFAQSASHRLAYYISRVALPDEEDTEVALKPKVRLIEILKRHMDSLK